MGANFYATVNTFDFRMAKCWFPFIVYIRRYNTHSMYTM